MLALVWSRVLLEVPAVFVLLLASVATSSPEVFLGCCLFCFHILLINVHIKKVGISASACGSRRRSVGINIRIKEWRQLRWDT